MDGFTSIPSTAKGTRFVGFIPSTADGVRFVGFEGFDGFVGFLSSSLDSSPTAYSTTCRSDTLLNPITATCVPLLVQQTLPPRLPGVAAPEATILPPFLASKTLSLWSLDMTARKAPSGCQERPKRGDTVSITIFCSADFESQIRIVESVEAEVKTLEAVGWY